MSKSTFKFQPLGDRILIEEITEKKGTHQTQSGIYLSEKPIEDTVRRAKVITLGDGKKPDGTEVNFVMKVGDTVTFQWGDSITLDGREFIMVRVGDISGIIKV